ncbi:helix-turn-helix domain-containing protein, partial [Lactobacillus paragasseri]|uniref:helix-turn-helix domain-containing protein n=1 Tax=Lactobacillus paragasseri TaxID=2107999 RepID=UPI003B93C8E4
MEIGTMLRNKRKILGLTQDQFIHGIISKSFYSKVERGLNEISAKDLFAILEANNINLNDFINNAGSTSKSDRLKVEILVAFNNKNKHEVQELNKKIQVSNCDQTIKLSSLLINAILNNKLDKINLNTRNEIKKKLFDVEKWWNNVYTLQLFCNSMLIFSFDDLTFYIQQLTKQKNINSLSFDVQRLIGSICINYFHNCY